MIAERTRVETIYRIDWKNVVLILENQAVKILKDSDDSAEMAATYYSVKGTVKLHGSSIWNFIGTFFKNIFNGCRGYVNMIPDKITLTISQC